MLLMRRALRNSLQLVAVVVLSLLSACADKPKGNVIPPDKLEDVLYDYHLAQVMISDLPSSDRFKKDFYFDYVYDKHGVTQEEIDSSLVYYARHPEGLSLIYSNLSAKITQELRRIDAESVEPMRREPISVVGDSANLWYDIPFLQLSSTPLENRYHFSVPTDTNFMANDRIEWSGKAVFINEVTDSVSHYLHLNLKVEYMNDSLLVADTLLYGSGNYSLGVVDTMGWQVKSVDGAVYLKGGEDVARLLIINPRLMRYHAAQFNDSLRADSLMNDSITLVNDSIR